MAQATKGPVVKSIPPTGVAAPARTAHTDSLTAGSHGILRIMNRPAQWVVIITLLISWSIAGVVMFDFVSDDQIASIQDFGSDPVLAVSKAIEGIENWINHMNDMLYDAHEYITEIIFNPREAISLAADSSVSYLSGIFSADGDSGVTETVKYGGTVLDEATEWIRTPVSYLFHLFEDILDIVITPVDMVTEVAVQILSGIKTIIQYISTMFGGIEGDTGITETVKLGGTLLDEVTEWIRFPVGYLFHLFEGILDVAIIYPGDIATEAVLQILSGIKTISSTIFGYLEVWFPKMSTGPAELAEIVVEKATDIKTTVSNYLTSLFAVDEGGIPDISFDPMKVVTDTVEEFADRRDMFLAYLSNMEDKDDTPQVIRRKGEFLPPMEKVAEIVGKTQDPAYAAYIAVRSTVKETDNTKVIKEVEEEHGELESAEDATEKAQDIQVDVTKEEGRVEPAEDSSDVTVYDDEVVSDVMEEDKTPGTVEDILDVTEEEPSVMPEVIDEELATEKVEDISDFIEDKSAMMASDATEDTDDASAVTEEKETTETIEEAAIETAEDTSNITTKTELNTDENEFQKIPNITEEDAELETVKDTSDLIGEIEEPETDEYAFAVTEETAEESLEEEQPPELTEATQDTICVKEKIAAKELNDHEVPGKDELKEEDKQRKEDVAIADAENSTKNLENEVDEDEVEVETKDQTILGTSAGEDDLDNEEELVLSPVQHDLTDRNDENNNNNDRMRDAIKTGLSRRKTSKSHSIGTNHQEAHEDLHEESHKVLEQVKEAKEKKAREEIYKIIQGE
ncbi:hypothetical protein cypCar_00008111 [Cyprinus carpio]|nr:hypothetical protein cypCar_00008111 [Cyprinus carpio]